MNEEKMQQFMNFCTTIMKGVSRVKARVTGVSIKSVIFSVHRSLLWIDVLRSVSYANLLLLYSGRLAVS